MRVVYDAPRAAAAVLILRRHYASSIIAQPLPLADDALRCATICYHGLFFAMVFTLCIT